MVPLKLSDWKAIGFQVISDATASLAFSTEVKLQLQVHGELLPVSAVGPERFVLATPQQLAGPDGCLIVTIDGEPRRTPILITLQSEPAREYHYQRR